MRTRVLLIEAATATIAFIAPRPFPATRVVRKAAHDPLIQLSNAEHVPAMSIALIVLPNFLLILGGYALHRWCGFERLFWNHLERLVYFVLFPALLFRALARTPIDAASAAPLVLAGALVLAIGMISSALARRLFHLSPALFASGFQCAFRFNSYIGLAVAGGLSGQPGIAALALLIGTMIPPANIASVWALAHHGGGALREIARNPLIIATLAGIVFSAAGLRLPDVAAQTLGPLGDAALPLGLFAVGAGLKLEGFGAARGAMVYWLAIKLLILPASAWALAQALDLSALYTQILILFAALPPSSSAYILAVRMGGDGRPVATLVTVGTLISMLTIPFWMTLVR